MRIGNISKKFTTPLLLVFSLLMAVYSPLAITNAHAQAEANALNELKEKVVKELDRRLAKYKNTEKKLASNVSASKETASAPVENKNAEEQDGDGVRTSLTTEIREKAKSMVSKVVDQLETMKEKVISSNSIDDVKKLAKNADAQYQVTQVVDLQGALSKAIDSMSGVYDKVGTIKGKLSGQIEAIKECFASKSATEVSQSGDVITDCDKLRDNADSEDIVRGAESREAGISTIMSAVKTILQSAISLFIALVTAFTGLLGGLGGGSGALENLGSLSEVNNLESLLGAGGSNGGTGSSGSLGNIGGLLTSFSSIIPQLTNALGMVSSVTGLLGSLTNFINVIPGASSMLGGLSV